MLSEREKRLWLNSYRDLMEEVERETRDAGYWRDKAQNLSPPKYDLSGSSSFNPHKIEDCLAEFLDLAKSCSQKAAEAERQKKLIIGAISKLEDPSQRKILRLRYIELKPIIECAKTLGYSTRSVYRIQNKAIKLLEVPESCHNMSPKTEL